MRSCWPRARRSSAPCPSIEGQPTPCRCRQNGGMSLPRLAAACFTVLVLAGSAQAEPRFASAPTTPRGLKPFLVRVDEAEAHTFSRTPSFAWTPVRNAALYEFELSTSDTFDEGSIVFSSGTLKTPAVPVTASLPWLTGKPYALYAHARAIAPDGST